MTAVPSLLVAQHRTLASDPAEGAVFGLSATAEAPPAFLHLDVVVTDHAGKPVTGLGQKDFNLLDNGSTAKILSFRGYDGTAAKPDPPTRIVFVIDTIDVPEKLVRDERVAVEDYLENAGRLGHPTSVYLLSELGFFALGHTSTDGPKLAQQIKHGEIRRLREYKGTAVDSVPMFALKVLGQIATAERRVPGRKLLLWVGPGWGLGTGLNLPDDHWATPIPKPSSQLFYTVRWFRALLRESRTALYSFAVGEEQRNPDFAGEYSRRVGSAADAKPIDLNRKVLAEQSGGGVPDDRYDLRTQIRVCLAEADAFYTLWFDPSPALHLDEFHSIVVKVNRPGLTARTNTAYYDEPYYSVDRYPPAKKLNIAELERLLQDSGGESDGELARQIAGVELTQRLSVDRLAGWTRQLRGKRTREAMVALADASAFLRPPSDEVPALPPPDAATQMRMIALIRSYLADTLTQLPDLLATRLSTHFREGVHYDSENWETVFMPLRPMGNSKTIVRYSHGLELDEREASHVSRPAVARRPISGHGPPVLMTYGTFGPMLGGMFQSMMRDGILTWDRWENGAGGTHLEVYRFGIRKEKSLFSVAVCCLPEGDGKQALDEMVGYHGEIAVVPSTGAILRLNYQAEFNSTTPLAVSDVVIEYGPVEIGGRKYICPQHSVSMVRARSVLELAEWDESFAGYGPYVTSLNDMRFTNYHAFRSESRILPGFTQ